VSAFTPGPWRACHEGECSCGQVWCDDYPVATVTRGKWGDTYPAIEQQDGTGSIERKYEAVIKMIEYGEVSNELAEANARLIAAAPQLYESAKAFVGALDAFLAASPGLNSGPEVAALRVAIAKAEGTC
jgi:hypothetical protein